MDYIYFIKAANLSINDKILMAQKFYVDTAIWRDYFEDRRDGLRPLGEFAFQFLKKCRENQCKPLYSEPVLFELKDFPKKWTEELFFSFNDLLIKVSTSKKQMTEAKQLSKQRNIPFNDAFHAVIARDNSAIVVTRDAHFFEELSDIVKAQVPEEIIFDWH